MLMAMLATGYACNLDPINDCRYVTLASPCIAELLMFVGHSHANAFRSFKARDREGVMLVSRRGIMKSGFGGLAGLTVPDLIRLRSDAIGAARKSASGKSVILLWMAGGPSHIDTLDPKPDRPYENRGPFGVTATKLPGVVLCEHLPRMAAMLDQF